MRPNLSRSHASDLCARNAHAAASQATAAAELAQISAQDRRIEKQLRDLIKIGPPFDAQDQLGMSAAMWSVQFGRSEVLGLLIQAGCDLDAKESDNGWTAAMQAAFRGYSEALDMLIQAGCELGTVDRQGYTILHYLQGGDPRCFELLVAGAALREKNDLAAATPAASPGPKPPRI